MIDRNKMILGPLRPEYIAGFFDGEGTVGLYKSTHGHSYRGCVAINLKNDTRNVRLLTAIADMYGSRVYQSLRTCTFYLGRSERIRQFIKDILPYTTIKTTQLILLDSWLENKTYGYRIHQLLKSQKRRA